MSYLAATLEGTPCPAPQTEGGQVMIRCMHDQLDIGPAHSVSVEVTLKVNARGGNVCNAAFVGSGSLDPVIENNGSMACDYAEPGEYDDPIDDDPISAPTGGSPQTGAPTLLITLLLTLAAAGATLARRAT